MRPIDHPRGLVDIVTCENCLQQKLSHPAALQVIRPPCTLMQRTPPRRHDQPATCPIPCLPYRLRWLAQHALACSSAPCASAPRQPSLAVQSTASGPVQHCTSVQLRYWQQQGSCRIYGPFPGTALAASCRFIAKHVAACAVLTYFDGERSVVATQSRSHAADSP